MNMQTVNMIRRYKGLEKEFSKALKDAGGMPSVILDQESWVSVLAVLAANNIQITAKYDGQTR